MLFPQNKLVLATHNQGKISEIKNMLQGDSINILSAHDLNLPAPEEIEKSFTGNALLKARMAMKLSGLTCLADDSGICVNALSGAPGVHSARWAGEEGDFKKAMHTIEEKITDEQDRSAFFVCIMALVCPNGREEIFEGRIEGDLVWPPRGEGGFGYDPMFQPTGHTLTFGEMNPSQKQSLSHRACALKKFLACVEEQNE